MTITEIEKLQTVAVDYTKFGDFGDNKNLISKTQRLKMIGNGFTISVISNFFRNIYAEKISDELNDW